MFVERCFFVFLLVKKCEEKRETYDGRIIGSTRVNVSIISTQKSVSVTTCAVRLVALLRATVITFTTIALHRSHEKPRCCCYSRKLFFFFREMILEKGPSLTSQKSGYGQSHERGRFCLPPPFSSRSSLLLLLLFSLSLVV